MFASNCTVLSVTTRTGISPKTNKPWEMIQVSVLDAGKEGLNCATPIDFNLDDADKDMAPMLKGLVVKVALTKIDTFSGRLDIGARISRKSFDDAYKAAGSPAPQVLGAPVSF